nr:uncharacterized mitochondrial protein AtMg00810-like [Tanacetum cinerariifolium]
MAISSSSSKNKPCCSKACKKNIDSLNSKITDLSDKLSDSKNMLYYYKLGLSLVEARLVEFKNQEIKFCEMIRGLEFKVDSKTDRIKSLTKELEELKKEKEGLDTKLTCFQSASKDLDTFIGSQRSDKNKEGLGYSVVPPLLIKSTLLPRRICLGLDYLKEHQRVLMLGGNQRNWNNLKSQQLGKNFVMKNKACFNCSHFDHLSYDYSKWVEKGKSWPKNKYTHKSMPPRTAIHKADRTSAAVNRPNVNNDSGFELTGFSDAEYVGCKDTFKSTSGGAQFLSEKLSQRDLPRNTTLDRVEVLDDTITDYSRPSPSIESNSDDLQNKNSSVTETEESSSTILSKPAIKFVKAVDRQAEIKTNKIETTKKSAVKYAEMYRRTSKSSNVRGNQRNWNNLKSQQLGKNFVMKNKACFNYSHFDHLSYDYGKWVEKGKSWPKNKYTHKSIPPRTAIHKADRTSAAVNRPNVNNARVKLLEDRDGGGIAQSGEDAPIKEMSLDEGGSRYRKKYRKRKR